MSQTDHTTPATTNLDPSLVPALKPLNRKLNFDDSPGLRPGACMSMLLLTKDLRGQSDSYLSNPAYRRPFYDSEDDDDSTIPRLPLVGGVQQSFTPSPSRMKENLIGSCQSPIEEESVETQTSLDAEVQDKSPKTSPVRAYRSRTMKPGMLQLTRTSLLCDEKNKDLELVRENSRETLDSEEACPEINRLLLPVSKNPRDPDLNIISAQTLVDLMTNQKNLNYLIVDCRYEYEYEGGHINGAVNIVTPELLEKVFFTHRNLVYSGSVVEEMKKDLRSVMLNPRNYNPFDSGSVSSNPPIIIFHCEFSQVRGPRAFRTLRNIDRQFNIDRFPNLYYPQIYVLEGGYRGFHTQFPEHCNGYVEMLASPCKEAYALARDREKRTWKKKFSVDILQSLESLKITEKAEKAEKELGKTKKMWKQAEK